MNLWTYRRIAARSQFAPGAYGRDISLVNWPQNDYWLGNLIGVSDGGSRAPPQARQAAEPVAALLDADRGAATRWRRGLEGLRLRADLTGTADGLAQYRHTSANRAASRRSSR